MLIGALVGLVPPGMTLLVLMYMPEVWPHFLAPHTPLLASDFFPLATAYAIVRFSLFDPGIVIRRSIVYVLLSVAIGFAYVGGGFAIQRIFDLELETLVYANVILVLTFSFMFPFLRHYTGRLVERAFFRSAYDADGVIRSISRRLVSDLDLGRILGEIDKVLRETLRAENACVLIRQQEFGALRSLPQPRARGGRQRHRPEGAAAQLPDPHPRGARQPAQRRRGAREPRPQTSAFRAARGDEPHGRDAARAGDLPG